MKTRALAKTLRQLALWLESIPDQSMDSLTRSAFDPHASSDALALNVSTLASLSRIDRREWISFIQEHSFPIDIRPRDASRDILGKLLSFLEREPKAVEYLQDRARSRTPASNELTRALRALLSYPG